MENKNNETNPNGPSGNFHTADRESGADEAVPAPAGRFRDWQRWTPYAALAWSLAYAGLGIFFAVSGRGFPYAPENVSVAAGPVAGRFGPDAAWVVVMLAGFPAAVMGVAMLRGVRGRLLRPLLITAGGLLAGTLLLLMTDINLLMMLAYVPYALVAIFKGATFGQVYLQSFIQWTLVHQLLCLIGGFLWLGATVSYARRSGDACLYCGRRDGPEGWTSPSKAAHWGRIAVYVALVVPVIYAFTRYAWALGFPLGITYEYWRSGQESGLWTSGLFLATFGLVGAALMLGLVQRWGEVFPRWMPGLSGRRVPTALAVVPASIISVLLMVGGIAMWSGFAKIFGASIDGQDMRIVIGPVALFPIWAASLAVATLGYYYRRRGPCKICGRGTPDEAAKTSSSPSMPGGHQVAA
jgi:hypothetical protein